MSVIIYKDYYIDQIDYICDTYFCHSKHKVSISCKISLSHDLDCNFRRIFHHVFCISSSCSCISSSFLEFCYRSWQFSVWSVFLKQKLIAIRKYVSPFPLVRALATLQVILFFCCCCCWKIAFKRYLQLL